MKFSSAHSFSFSSGRRASTSDFQAIKRTKNNAVLWQLERFKIELASRGLEIPPVVVRLLFTHRHGGHREGVRRLTSSVQIRHIADRHVDKQLQQFIVTLRENRVTIPPIVAKLLTTKHQVPPRMASSEALTRAGYTRVTRNDVALLSPLMRRAPLPFHSSIGTFNKSLSSRSTSSGVKGATDASRNTEAGTELTLGEGAFALGPRAKAVLKGIEIAREDIEKSGGSYNLEQVRQILHGVSRQSVEKRVREGNLLAVLGPSNRRYYPAVQFKNDGSVVEGLSAIQNALPTRNAFAILNFLVNADPRINNRKPIDLLKDGKIDIVVEAARRVGEQGA
jgi:hypothetical protein